MPLAAQLTPVVEAAFGLDGGAMFGIVPRPLWERTNPPDARNRIAMAARVLYFELGDRRVLIDTGIGRAWSAKEADIYGVALDEPPLTEKLRTLGIEPTAITDVILTHLHFDHAGGAIVDTVEGPRPTFPGATHWVQRENWVWAHGPSVRDAGSYRRRDFARLGDAVDLRLVDGHAAPFDGVELIVTRGHTPGMQLVKVRTAAQTVLYTADLIPTASHLHVPYVMGYDVYPLTTCAEKADLLEQATRHGWVLALEHDPDAAFVVPERRPDGRFVAAARADTLAGL
ncbi:MAG: MBL fold metallo-hydrolase [Myxococcales bacterium]|nr:MBL fold metallo-hydrolase [Myxococcales bacterium]MCB9521607.1 MBL fold metallo-hydrolase [Myxococcales bacterium]MCB9532413.1 MBL fold metallo-hydrolase [Myxococcales bacterium]